jgi:glutamyl-tRNA synthetase
LIAWLAARSRDGQIVLRIEDIDSPRIKAGAAQQACDDLRWLGLDWDLGPIIQSERLASYESALRQLQARELVYPCTCSRRDIELAASAPHADHEGPVYPGTCAGRGVADAANLTQPYAWRFRAESARPTISTFDDGYRGRVEVDVRELGDFVVWTSARTPAYQLAVVVDDAAQGITQIVRGDDLIPSTPRQLLLYQALGLAPPAFVHVPLVVGPDLRRLAKRHGDTRLATLRQDGVTAQALLGLLAWSCGWTEQMQPITTRELLPLFRLDAIPPEPFVLQADRLRKME